MTKTAVRIVKCPLCGSDGEILRHDLRASLVYACKVCLHEWQIDPADEPPEEAVPPPAERPGIPVASSRRSRKP